MSKSIFNSECGCWFVVEYIKHMEEFLIVNIETTTLCIEHAKLAIKSKSYYMEAFNDKSSE